MFTRLTNTNNELIIINVAQIVSLEKEQVFMSNNTIFALDNDSQKKLEEQLIGTNESWVQGLPGPVASGHDSNLLNELHHLLGGHGDAKPTTDRKARLKTRLKDFSEDELKVAATNLGTDEFMQGANDNNKRYGTIDYLIRTSANVNKWLEETPQKKKGMF